jgi:hypothetical protein
VRRLRALLLDKSMDVGNCDQGIPRHGGTATLCAQSFHTQLHTLTIFWDERCISWRIGNFAWPLWHRALLLGMMIMSHAIYTAQAALSFEMRS